MTIAVLPLGYVEKSVISALVSDLRTILSREVVEGPQLGTPIYALDRARAQFNSTDILDWLSGQREVSGFEKALGVVEADLYASGLNFVFGEAGSRVAVISLARLREGFYGKPENVSLTRKRTLTEAAHELGHTWGLGHCEDPFCVMFFSVTLQHTDRKGHEFKGGCKKRMQELGLLKGY